MIYSSYQDSVGKGEYDPEAATNFFDELETALHHRPDYPKVYQAMNRTFRKCLNQRISQDQISFGGDFAKTDYLLKELGATRRLVKSTNDTRVRLRNRGKLSTAVLQRFCLYDLKNLCQFIAFIYQTDIPGRLVALFPTEKVPSFTPALVGDCMRGIVEQWDDDYVYVQTEESTDGELRKVCYAHGNRNYNFPWSYLKGLFRKGAQLNLVRPREEDGIIYPELIIYEPDYLVNITTVAHCFTNYADAPYVELIKKLEPQANSDAIVLGNFAGQLLDETIHQLPFSHEYKDSVMDFFHHHAVSLLTIVGGDKFHQEGKRQKYNITRAVHEALPSMLGSFNSKDGIVEPSFFSEMLGLQGRMDYLQLDFKVLMEQKSGKGAYPQNYQGKARQQDEHYVQLLLYMALIRYNFREIYERNGKQLHAFLLYSKYHESLLGLGFAPELIFKAFRIRNQLVWMELNLTRPNGYRILERLTPEKLNQKQVVNKLWTDFQCPQITAFLSNIKNASELEKAYYFRFLTFIANEHVLSKLGNQTRENSGFAATWHDSVEDKRQAGNIYDRLTLVSPNSMTTGRISLVELRFSETEDNGMSNFRVGDVVILYPYTEGQEPDARKTMVHRCSIEAIGTDTIRLSLRAVQSDNRIFMRGEGMLWAIEHDFIESSYSGLYRGMQAFLNTHKERRDLILLQRAPKTDPTIELSGDYGDFNDLALRVKQARDLFLIIGPPGTGKTSFGMLYTVKEELMNPDASVLLLSYTNRAVDEICGKLVEEGIDFIRVGTTLGCAEAYRDKMLNEKARRCGKVDEFRRTLLSTRVMVGTTSSFNNNMILFELKQFSLAVIDEASQILEPHLMGILSAQKDGVPAIRKFVLIGDHKQLPAVVQQSQAVSRVDEAKLLAIHLTDCRLSLFERLLRQYAGNPEVTYMLRKQGRMHHDIALFPNYAFYRNQLQEVPRPHQHVCLPLEGEGINGITDLLRTRRIAFVAAEAPTDSPSDKVNSIEADMIAALVVHIYALEASCFDVNRTVGVIVPYRNQIATIRKAIDRYDIPLLHDITIDTVERYQGSQRKYIIYGFTIQQYYQLSFLANHVFEDFDGSIVDRKLNVAMTRAEEHLLLVGNAELLSNNFTFFKLMEYVRSRHGFFRVRHDDFVAGRFEVPPYDVVELDLSKASYTVTDKFQEAFDRNILFPVREESGDGWPDRVFGYDMATNLNAIGYGRASFSGLLRMVDGKDLSAERQVLVYGYYLLRQYYCSSRKLFMCFKPWLDTQIASVDGRVQMIDLGCGPATGGMAFAELFHEAVPLLVYTGVDTSKAMLNLGQKMLENMFDGQLFVQMKASFSDLSTSFWEGCSDLPSLVIFNLSYLFSNVSAQFAEELARQICEVMRRFPLNRYVFFIQLSDIDKQLNAWQVFRKILEPLTTVIREETDSCSYVMGQQEHTIPFTYCVMTGI